MASSVAVIVPNLNGGSGVLDTLRAILASLPDEAQVTLVDDGSTDGSVDRVRALLPQVQVLPFPRTRGAAFARNQGLQAARRDLLFCVDADVFCPPGCLPALARALQTADIVFPQLLSPSGDVLNPRTRFARRCCLDSAVFGVRRTALARLDALFDETIQVYGEDNDFFLRARRLGLDIRHVPTARAVHPRAALVGERHYYLGVRNAIYVWLKLRGLVSYWMPMDLWIWGYLGLHLAGALLNRPLGGGRGAPVRFTDGPRLRLLWHFWRAVVWNLRHLRVTRARRRAFEAFLYANSHL
jgi:GT2 family glycosyltransferase